MENYIKRTPPSLFKVQGRGGQGKVAMSTKEEDEIAIIRFACNHDRLLFFTNTGRAFQLPVYELPKANRQAKGTPLVNLIQLSKDEHVTAMLVVKNEEFAGKYLIMATTHGTIKKTSVDDFANVRRNGLNAIKLRDGDSLNWVRQVDQGDWVTMVTKEGKCIKFDQDDVRPMGRVSVGVRGIKLRNQDQVVEMDVVKDLENASLLVIMENGLGKRTPISEYRSQSRGGSGVKTANLSEKTGLIVGAKILEPETDGEIMVVSKKGVMLRTPLSSIPDRGRATQGVYIMRPKPGDKVSSMTFFTIDPNVSSLTEESAEVSTEQISLMDEAV